jgi:hypothetical protein
MDEVDAYQLGDAHLIFDDGVPTARAAMTMMMTSRCRWRPAIVQRGG